MGLSKTLSLKYLRPPGDRESLGSGQLAPRPTQRLDTEEEGPRSADRGLLTLSDRYGRIVTEAHTSAGFTTLVGNLPLMGHGGATLYDRIGDAFGWLCLAFGGALVAVSLIRVRRLRARSSNPIR